uniref:Uncharacterized protein n=1 Tax=Anguilla anguilla TaxID=7936 RepID=A0A0E9V5T5_ANGAN
MLSYIFLLSKIKLELAPISESHQAPATPNTS